jgi:putative transcriptional regulator
MIKLVVREVAEREGIKSPRELERATGLSYSTAYGLWKGNPRMIQLETIELLCTRLGVRPGQLFQFEADRGKLDQLVTSKQKARLGKPSNDGKSIRRPGWRS